MPLYIEKVEIWSGDTLTQLLLSISISLSIRVVLSYCLQIVIKIIYIRIGGFLMRLSDFSLVGDVIDHEVLP